MHTTVFIQSAALINSSGISSMHKATAGWLPDQKSPADLRREQVLDRPMPEFGKLQTAEKLAFGASAIAFSACPQLDRSKFGICLGTAFGSISTDIKYMQSVDSGFPSPALFSATLPSSPLAEIAIFFKMTGTNRVLPTSACPLLNALDSALSIFRHRKAPGMLAVSLSVPAGANYNKELADSRIELSNYAFAMLLTSERVENGANISMSVEGELDFRDTEDCDESYLHNAILSCARNDFSHTETCGLKIRLTGRGS